MEPESVFENPAVQFAVGAFTRLLVSISGAIALTFYSAHTANSIPFTSEDPITILENETKRHLDSLNRAAFPIAITEAFLLAINKGSFNSPAISGFLSMGIFLDSVQVLANRARRNNNQNSADSV